MVTCFILTTVLKLNRSMIMISNLTMDISTIYAIFLHKKFLISAFHVYFNLIFFVPLKFIMMMMKLLLMEMCLSLMGNLVAIVPFSLVSIVIFFIIKVNCVIVPIVISITNCLLHS